MSSSSGHTEGGGLRRHAGPSPGVARSKARRIAVQALYQWDVGGGGQLADIEQQFLEQREVRGADLEYFHRLLFGVAGLSTDLDDSFAAVLDRTVEQLDPVERAVLRIATWELQHAPEVPVRVVINEGIEMAKRFGADQSHKYINGVLDGLARQMRAPEMTLRRTQSR